MVFGILRLYTIEELIPTNEITILVITNNVKMMVNGQYDIRVNDGKTLLSVLVDAPSTGLSHFILLTLHKW
jgi:hypothetical protein